MANKRVDQPTGTETVGHEWDGIEELDTPLPRWWLWTFYASIVFAIGYVIAFPAWPMIHTATSGVLGWSSRGELAKDMAEADEGRSEFRAQLAITPVEKLAGDPDLMARAVAGGRAAFLVNCVQCHGSGAAGSAAGGAKGYPNLNDDDWLWGGDMTAIHTTLEHGIRYPGDDETRFSAMPAFAGMFDDAQMDGLVSQVLSFSGKGKANPVGAQIYADNCASCHGPAGQGDRNFGAPNLSDAIWIYGSSREEIARQIQQPRMGVMPGWSDRLDEGTIKMLTAYVHSLGGGEELIAQPETDTPVDAQVEETDVPE
ncbi:cytochrome-c oxidase, cbb3-type subunit III [Croceicoccus mobilis]|uniref:Cbb3-type cytochrome c oxidase subunit n=1 Tax=Croceicoccus mobilis TaxID=1703339 RepID=A0A917DV16_9SPHN|nr:cytochrome-c oxidase, cbb3-type subunit III [Croceicoccus mobilis]GGD73265.1 Cbb3-type cytochrome c oxidase subunit [Croceicoccus mobilis]